MEGGAEVWWCGGEGGSHKGKRGGRRAPQRVRDIEYQGKVENICMVKINEGKIFTKHKKLNYLPSSDFLGIQLRQKGRDEWSKSK